MVTRNECPNADALHALANQQLDGHDDAATRHHVARCARCHEALLEAGRTLPGRNSEGGPWYERGALIGRYVVTERLGTGGMGVIYAAYDPELNRKVALKLLHGLAGADVEARFRREAYAIASLSHPNVVAIYDVGTHDGRLFIAMELVDGVTLREWQRQPRGWRAILDCYLAAGRGLQAAHAAGLVHRDFKPDNVMIGRDGRVRVLDFGLARAADESATPPLPAGDSDGDGEVALIDAELLAVSITRTGHVVGTPAYMAPEQLQGGAASDASDQFSFCVALYESLAGARPFGGATPAELLGAISAGRRETSGEARMPPWLRQVVTRGLSVRPGERYATMGALLGALARDPTAVRRRRALGLGAVVLVAVLAFVGARGFGRERAQCSSAGAELAGVWSDGRRAALHGVFARLAGRDGEEAFTRTTAVLDDYARAWRAGAVDACEATRVRHTQSEPLLDRRMACLRGLRNDLGTFAAHLDAAGSADLMQAPNAARSLTPVASCDDAVAIAAAVPPPPAEARARVEALDARLAEVRTLALFRQWPTAAARLGALGPDIERVGYAPLSAEAAFLLGTVDRRLGRYAAAEEHLHLAIERAEVTHDDGRAAAALAELTFTLAEVRHFAEMHQVARLAEGVALRVGSPARRAELEGAIGWGNMLEDDFAGAERHLGRAVAWREREPGRPLELARALANLVSARMAEQKHDGTLAEIERARALYTAELGAEHPMLVRIRADRAIELAVVGADAKRGDDALAEARAVLALATRAFGPDHVDTVHARNALAFVLDLAGRYEESLALYRQVLAVEERDPTPGDDLEYALRDVGWALYRLHRYAEAQGMLERAIRVGEAIGCPFNMALDRADLGAVLMARGQPAAALDACRGALGVLDSELGADAFALARPLACIGTALDDLGRDDEARAPFERGLALYGGRQLLPFERARLELGLGRALWRRDRPRARALLDAVAATAADAHPAAAELHAALTAAHARLR